MQFHIRKFILTTRWIFVWRRTRTLPKLNHVTQYTAHSPEWNLVLVAFNCKATRLRFCRHRHFFFFCVGGLAFVFLSHRHVSVFDVMSWNRIEPRTILLWPWLRLIDFLFTDVFSQAWRRFLPIDVLPLIWQKSGAKHRKIKHKQSAVFIILLDFLRQSTNKAPRKLNGCCAVPNL